MPLPPALGGLGINTLVKFMSGFFGGLFGSPGKPDLPAGLEYRASVLFGQRIDPGPPPGWEPRIPDPRFGPPSPKPPFHLKMNCLYANSDAIVETQTGIVVGEYRKSKNQAYEVLGFSLDGVPISGRWPKYEPLINKNIPELSKQWESLKHQHIIPKPDNVMNQYKAQIQKNKDIIFGGDHGFLGDPMGSISGIGVSSGGILIIVAVVLIILLLKD